MNIRSLAEEVCCRETGNSASYNGDMLSVCFGGCMACERRKGDPRVRERIERDLAVG